MDSLAFLPQPTVVEIGPQLGPQEMFMSTSADIAFFGGAAGGGKSFAILLDQLRNVRNPYFGAVIFRRTTKQVKNTGGLWDESMSLYSRVAGVWPKKSDISWRFNSGATVKFSHLEYDRTVLDWQGSQITSLGFDELTHFSQYQFFYMLSRNRSTCGVKPRVRGTCNPDVDSWVRRFIDWWIGEDGFAIPERSGVIRWFIRKGDEIVWGDSREELVEKYGDAQLPKSFTFICSKISDNKILLQKDPGYLSNLMALPRVERMRLLEGNWNIRRVAGNYFNRSTIEVIRTLPAGWKAVVRYWDRASTKPHEGNKNPDYTAGLKMYQYADGTYVVANVTRIRDTPNQVQKLIKTVASQDGGGVKIVVEQDPGQAGVADANNYTRLLAGYDVRVNRVTKDKVTRALAVSAQCEAGNVKVLEGEWNDAFFSELEAFPPEETSAVKRAEGDEDRGHDDQVDVLSGAFNELCGDASILDSL